MTTCIRMVRTLRAPWGRAAAFLLAAGALLAAGVARADESELVLPDLGSVTFLGMNGRTLLMGGILVFRLRRFGEMPDGRADAQ